MKSNFIKAFFGNEREQEAIADIPKFQKIHRPAETCRFMGTSPASREQKRQKHARRITRRYAR